MSEIRLLDDATVDKIAAGEVVERPASVVKELVENSIDAGARAVTVEIKDGGIEFIRVTDDGAGIERSQLRNAFMRHATSKIKSVSDLMNLASMGFRGEALSSIAAVSKVEIVTKTSGDITGTRLCLEGASETSFEEVGAPCGTTFIVRNLFFNTPVRRKFLKTAMTEASYITDLLEHMALSSPNISFKYVINGQTKFYTNGDGDLRAIIYRIFGRDIANEMLEFHVSDGDITLDGFLGKTALNRANRNFENYFLNRRYIKSKIISKAIEDGYKSYMMQHRYPFCVLHITVPPESVDVNVHPTKMEVRFANQNSIYNLIMENISGFLSRQEMIPHASLGKDEKSAKKEKEKKAAVPEPFEKERKIAESAKHGADYSANYRTNHGDYSANYRTSHGADYSAKHTANILREESGYNAPRNNSNVTFVGENEVVSDFFTDNRVNTRQISESGVDPTGQRKCAGAMRRVPLPQKETENRQENENQHKTANQQEAKPRTAGITAENPRQLNFFDEKMLTREAKQEYRIVGQVFDTYWIVEYRDKMLMIDQHAAHEKVKYEQILKKVEQNEVFTQTLSPPAVISVTPKEAGIINEYGQYFTEFGFEIEDFGMNAFAVRGVPIDLFSHNLKELFEEILTQLSESPAKGVPQVIREKIASMACKAAVKGNKPMSVAEADELIEQLLGLDNPYNCPHGRPTIIEMSRYEVERKFKRTV